MNNVLPGWIDSLPATEERRKSVPLGHYGNADEVAATIAFLASDGTAYITGQNICVDGAAVRPPPRGRPCSPRLANWGEGIVSKRAGSLHRSGNMQLAKDRESRFR